MSLWWRVEKGGGDRGRGSKIMSFWWTVEKGGWLVAVMSVHHSLANSCCTVAMTV